MLLIVVLMRVGIVGNATDNNAGKLGRDASYLYLGIEDNTYVGYSRVSLYRAPYNLISRSDQSVVHLRAYKYRAGLLIALVVSQSSHAERLAT